MLPEQKPALSAFLVAWSNTKWRTDAPAVCQRSKLRVGLEFGGFAAYRAREFEWIYVTHFVLLQESTLAWPGLDTPASVSSPGKARSSAGLCV